MRPGQLEVCVGDSLSVPCTNERRRVLESRTFLGAALADVFISYSRKDRKAAELVSRRIQKEGWTTWWDQSLKAGERWDDTIRSELSQAKCVLVLWSQSSWASKWVQAEAHSAFSRNILVAGILDGVRLDAPFNIIQAANLRSGNRPEDIEGLLSGIRAVVGPPQSAAPPTQLSERDLPPLQGVEFKVRLVTKPAGITLYRDDDGSLVTDRRSLSQADLERVPQASAPCLFVNLTTNSGELVSCIVAGEDSEVFGSMRAFWWCLARLNVTVVSSLLYGSGLRGDRLAEVCLAAQTAWAKAVEHHSISEMRDQMVLIRDVHFRALTSMIEGASDWETRAGFKIARAMVLAVQSEDRLLERATYERFRKYLWVRGDEPAELAVHDQFS